MNHGVYFVFQRTAQSCENCESYFLFEAGGAEGGPTKQKLIHQKDQ